LAITSTCSAVEVTGRAPPSVVFQRIISRIDTVFGTEELEIVCVALRELALTCNVSGDN
jgi:hypothetical protein